MKRAFLHQHSACPKVILTITLAFSSYVSAGEYIPVDEKKTHLEFDLAKKPFPLKFYRTKEMIGKPEMELKNNGLYIGGKKLCVWPTENFDAKDSPNMVLYKLPHRTACKLNPILRSTWGDGGTGTAVLTVQIEKLDGDLAFTRDLVGDLYFSLKNQKGKFQKRGPNELSNDPGM